MDKNSAPADRFPPGRCPFWRYFARALKNCQTNATVPAMARGPPTPSQKPFAKLPGDARSAPPIRQQSPATTAARAIALSPFFTPFSTSSLCRLARYGEFYPVGDLLLNRGIRGKAISPVSVVPQWPDVNLSGISLFRCDRGQRALKKEETVSGEINSSLSPDRADGQQSPHTRTASLQSTPTVAFTLARGSFPSRAPPPPMHRGKAHSKKGFYAGRSVSVTRPDKTDGRVVTPTPDRRPRKNLPAVAAALAQGP